MIPIANFAKYDNFVCRSARAETPEQARWLVDEIGVKRVCNFEWEQSDDAAFAGLPVKLIRIADFEPLPWIWPSVSDERVLRFLAEVVAAQRAGDMLNGHCRSGQNRTGVHMAAYRLILRYDALDPVLADFASYRGAWAWGDERYIRTLLPRRDAFRRQLGIAPPL